MVRLIKSIGTLVARVDGNLEYTRRSFCVLELYAAATARINLICQPEFASVVPMEHSLAQTPVNSAAATTRRAEDKAKIDAFIRASIGFEQLDAVVTQQIIRGASGYMNACECCCLGKPLRAFLPWWCCLRLRQSVQWLLGYNPMDDPPAVRAVLDGSGKKSAAFWCQLCLWLPCQFCPRFQIHPACPMCFDIEIVQRACCC